MPGYSRIRMSASIGGVWIDDENVDDAVQHAERLMNYARIQKNTVSTERQPEPHALQPTHSRQSVLIVDEMCIRDRSGVHPMELYRVSRDNPAKLPGWRRYVYPIYTTYNLSLIHILYNPDMVTEIGDCPSPK